jgi:hypothetical protein
LSLNILKQKEQVSQRAKEAGQTIKQRSAQKQIKRQQRAAEKLNQTSNLVSNSLNLALSSAISRLETETVAPIPEETLNQTWSEGSTESVSAERKTTTQLTEALTDLISEG